MLPLRSQLLLRSSFYLFPSACSLCSSQPSPSAAATASCSSACNPAPEHRRRRSHAGAGPHGAHAKRSVSTAGSSGSSTSTTAEPANNLQTDIGGVGALQRKVDAASLRLDAVLHVFDLPAAKARLASLENDASASGCWDDAAKGQQLLARLGSLREEVEEVSKFSSLLEEAKFAVELLEAEAGAPAAEQAPILAEASALLQDLDSRLEKWELRRLLAGTYDECGARLSITAGAGGVDAMDWAEMLERMYLRWCQQQAGEEAGLKSCEVEVSGRYAYGYLRSERGTHRLVRNSPFNAKGLRQTSFAGVEVMPLLDASMGSAAELEIPDKDLEISFMRAGGKGGQNVNKVETGVRIVHLPTGLAVKCIQERTQLLNRAIAMDMLRAKLMVVLEEQQAKKVAEIRGDMVQAAWGQQIRNYVLHPYKLVKDARTGCETADAAAVLDGHGLAPFMTAFLRHKGRLQTDQVNSNGDGEDV